MFVLPYLGLIVLALRRGGDERRDALRVMMITIAAGVVAYLLVNVVYAPRTWLERMNFWLRGPGIDADVWGHSGVRAKFTAAFNIFGPAGSVVVAAAVLLLLIGRPRRWVMLLLPPISAAALGVARIQYPADRFYTILSVAMFPATAAGLSELLRRLPVRGPRPAAVGALVVLGAANVLYATLTWNVLYGTFEYQAERHALAHVPKSDSVYLFNWWPWNPGSTRLDYLGYRNDPRSIQQIASQMTDLPQWVYGFEGKLHFFMDAKLLPKRAEMVKEVSGFDVSTWNGLEGLGYRLEETVDPPLPAWYPFKSLPAVKEWRIRRKLMVYHLPATAPAATPATRTSP
jgi:hypothetical protein